MDEQRQRDDALLAKVLAETRQGRALWLVAAALPGALLALVAISLRVWLGAAAGLVISGVAIGWQARRLGPFARLAAGQKPDHFTFSGDDVFASFEGRRVTLFGASSRSSEFRQAIHRRWPDAPQLTSVWPVQP